MHDMIIVDERDHNIPSLDELLEVDNTHGNLNFEEYIQEQVEIEKRDMHFQLRNNLIEHL